MNTEIKQLLESVANGLVSVDDALLKLKTEPFADIGFAKVDLHRQIRQGQPEVIYGAGKTPEQTAAIIRTMLENDQRQILITRISSEDACKVAGVINLNFTSLENRLAFRKFTTSTEKRDPASNDPDALAVMTYYPESRIALIGGCKPADGLGTIVVATGGTSDIPVAEEAAITAEVYGNDVVRLYDVGVAGIHRLLNHKEDIMKASVVIAVAGMEGALASVIGGLVDCPVVAVPTSVGYGASFGGLSALLSMLNSCASGVSVVNIDNGFGAGYLASMINHMKKNP